MEITKNEIEAMARICKKNARTDKLIQDYIWQAMEMKDEEGKAKGEKELVLFFLKVFRPDIVGKGTYDWGFMYNASEKGWADVVEVLIKMGLNPTTGLLPAVSNGHKKVVEILLDNGADLKAPNCGNVREVAKSCGYAEISEILEAVWEKSSK